MGRVTYTVCVRDMGQFTTLQTVLLLLTTRLCMQSQVSCPELDSCRTLPYGKLTNWPEQSHLLGAVVKHLTVEVPDPYKKDQLRLYLPSPCLRNVSRLVHPYLGESGMTLNFAPYVLSTSDKLQRNCTVVPGTWFVIGNKHSLISPYEDFMMGLFPTYLTCKLGCTLRQLNLTHAGGIPTSWPFRMAYKAFGEYVDWSQLIAPEHNRNGACVTFSTALIASAYWIFNVPVHVRYDNPLLEMVQYIKETLNLTTGPNRCKLRVLYISRLHNQRRVHNDKEVIAAVTSVFGNETVLVETEMHKLPYELQISRFLTSDIVVGPHGAAMTHTLWMPHGGVVIELSPYNSVHAMYRNIPTLTGKIYMPWSPPNSSYVHGEANRMHNFRVDVTALVPLLKAAKMIAMNNIGDRWADVEGNPHKYQFFYHRGIEDFICNNTII